MLQSYWSASETSLKTGVDDIAWAYDTAETAGNDGVV